MRISFFALNEHMSFILFLLTEVQSTTIYDELSILGLTVVLLRLLLIVAIRNSNTVSGFGFKGYICKII